MTVIPFRHNADEYSIFCALDSEGVARIKAYDPAQLEISKLGDPWQGLRLRGVLVGYVTTADIEHIRKMLATDANNVEDILKYLSRGFAFRPEAGDHDGPYLSMKDTSGTKQ